MSLGIFVSINQRIDAETIAIVADEFGFEVEFVSNIGKKFALRTCLKITCYEKNKIVACVPVRLGGVEELGTATFPYQGVLLQKNEYKELHSQVANELRILNFFIKAIIL
jgi:hypothetical protein